MLGRADERGVDVRGLGVALAHELDRLHRPGEPAARPGPAAARRRGRSSTCGCAPAARTTRSWWSSGTATTRAGTSPTSAASTCATRAATTRRTAATRRRWTRMADEYGDTPPWHDIQAAISGPAVHDVETVFRERWEDPTTLRRSPIVLLRDRLRGLDTTPDPLPEQRPPPPPARPARRPAAAHLPQPAAGARLRVRPRRRAQRGPRLHQGRRAGPAPDLRRGPVPVGRPRRQRLRRGAAPPPRPARHRGRADAPGRGRPQPDRPAAGPPARDARHAPHGARPGRGLRHREPRGHADLRARQDLHRRRHLGDHRLRQLQPPLLDPRLRAVGGRGRPGRRVRPRPAAHAGRRAPRPDARRTSRTSPSPRRCSRRTPQAAAALDDWHAGGRSVRARPAGSGGSTRRRSGPYDARSRSRRTSGSTTRTADPGRCAAATASEPARFWADRIWGRPPGAARRPDAQLAADDIGGGSEAVVRRQLVSVRSAARPAPRSWSRRPSPRSTSGRARGRRGPRRRDAG